MTVDETSHVGSSGLLTQIDKKIKNLVKSKEQLESREKSFESLSQVSEQDFEKFHVKEDLSKLKEIQRERLLEDMSLILNDKIKELEQKEKSDEKKEQVLTQLTEALNEKIFQLEVANKKLAEEKQHSDTLNTQLQETITKLTEAEKELKIERDWLADQVEKKSLEVLNTIDQLIKAENKTL